jgi:hypothetical protein
VDRLRPGYPASMTTMVENVQRLLDSDLDDPHLVLVQGELQVVPGPDPQDGALVVTSRAALLQEYGGTAPTGAQLDLAAAGLQTAVDTLGG